MKEDKSPPTRQEALSTLRWVPVTGFAAQLEGEWTEKEHSRAQRKDVAHDPQRL